MKTFRQMMTYKPPDIQLFRQFGEGYLAVADGAVDRAEIAFYRARLELLKHPTTWGLEPQDIPEKDLVTAYGYWSMADDMIKRLDRMEKSEREKQLALDTNEKIGCTYQLVLQRHADLNAQMLIDEKHDLGYQAALNRQLERRLNTWEKALKRAEENDFEEEGEQFETVEDFCEERDIIEYVSMGLHTMRNLPAPSKEEARFQSLSYLDVFAMRRLKLDELFRRALRGRYSYAPWAELPQFWWHHNPKDVERFTKELERRIDQEEAKLKR